MGRTSGFSKDTSGARDSSGQLVNVTYNSAGFSKDTSGERTSTGQLVNVGSVQQRELSAKTGEEQAKELLYRYESGQISQTQFQEMTGQTPQQLQTQIKTLSEGGYFYNPITKETKSSMQDLTKQGYVRVSNRTQEQINTDIQRLSPNAFESQPTTYDINIGVPSIPLSEVQRYQQAGYSLKESQALAGYSVQTQTTPTPNVAEQILQQNVDYTFGERTEKYGVLPTVKYYREKGFEKIGQVGSEYVDINYALLGFGLPISVTPSFLNKNLYGVSIGLPVKSFLSSWYGEGKNNIPGTTINKNIIPASKYGFISNIDYSKYINLTTGKFTQEQTAKAIEIGAGIGHYAIPYVGQVSFWGVDVGSFATNIKRQGISYIGTHKFETTVIGGILGIEAYTHLKVPISKLSKGYVPIKETGVKFVEGTTIPRSTEYLKSFEEGTAFQVHTTLSPELKYGSTLIAQPEMATGWRKSIGQFQFYTSAPEISQGEQKAVAYLGYVGIGESTSPSVTKFSLFKPTAKAFIFEQQVTKTPGEFTKADIKRLVAYQSAQAGKTFVPAENLFGLSKEGQFTTSVKNIEKGYAGTQIIPNVQSTLFKKFTYIKVSKTAPKFIENLGLSKPYIFLTTRQEKISFYPSEFVGLDISGKPIKTPEISGKTNIINLEEYTSSYGNVRYISGSSIIKSVTPSISKISISSRVSQPSYFKSSFVKSIPRGYISSPVKSLISIPSYPSKPSYPSYPRTPSIPEIPTTVILESSMGDYGDIIKARKLPARRITEYTPSYGALVFKIRGKPAKKTSMGFTGLELRKIPAGFNYGKTFKRIIKRKVKGRK